MKDFKCPVCEKGNLISGEKTYSCDYFKSLDDKCSFVIWKNMYGVELKEETIEELCSKKATEPLSLFTKDGVEYKARLVLNVEHKKIYAVSDDSIIDNELCNCPKCKSKIKELTNSFKCSDENCDFLLYKKIANKTINVEDLEKLLTVGKTDFYDFQAKNGNSFTASIKLDEEYNTVFDNELCKCPVCENGIIKAWENNYSCTNKDFTLFKNHNGAVSIEPKIAIQLCEEKETPIIEFISKENNKYKAKLVLNDENKIVTVK